MERMLQDWTKYKTEVLEGHTGAQDATSRTTWDDVVPDGDIGALATTVHKKFEDCSRPDHPFGDNSNPAIKNAILAYHSWSTQQNLHLHCPHDDPRKWHPIGLPPLEFYLHEDAATGAHSITSLRPTMPQQIPEQHIPPVLRNPKRPRNTNMGPRNKSTAQQPTKGPNPPTPTQLSNNSTSLSPRVTSQTTTNYPEGGTTQGARQRHGNYRQAPSIGRKSSPG